MSDRGYKRLSAAIVIEAFQDATGMKLSMTGSHTPRNKGAQRRQEARAFIESERLEMWCSVLDLDPDAIRDRVRYRPDLTQTPPDAITACLKVGAFEGEKKRRATNSSHTKDKPILAGGQAPWESLGMACGKCDRVEP